MTKLIVTKRMMERPNDSWTLKSYLDSGGMVAARKALKEMSKKDVLTELMQSKLRGRGGAGFPTAKKWSFVGKSFPRYLCVNGDEAEVGTFKDRMLMERDPFQLLEGMIIASYCLEVEHAFIYCRGELRTAYDRLTKAVEELENAGYLGRNIFDTKMSLKVTVHRAGGAYIAGEETALLSSLEGYRAWPRLKPPFPAVEGLYAQPTIVNNVETISYLPWIMENGGKAFAAMGTDGSAGTRLFCLSGDVNRPGNFELEQGTTFREFVDRWGQGVRNNSTVKAIIPGGASAPWFGAEALDYPMDDDFVASKGSMMGSGGIMIMNQEADIVAAAWRLVKFFAVESCGQCTPCREGITWLSDIYERLLSGQGRSQDIDLLLDIGDNISPGLKWPPVYTTICVLAPSAVAPIESSIRMFRGDYEARVTGGPDGGPGGTATGADSASSGSRRVSLTRRKLEVRARQ